MTAASLIAVVISVRVSTVTDADREHSELLASSSLLSPYTVMLVNQGNLNIWIYEEEGMGVWGERETDRQTETKR